jgi:hypothetical protein
MRSGKVVSHDLDLLSSDEEEDWLASDSDSSNEGYSDEPDWVPDEGKHQEQPSGNFQGKRNMFSCISGKAASPQTACAFPAIDIYTSATTLER